MVNLLLGIASPFDFKLVEKFQPYLKYDKIIPKYYPEVEAYKIIRDFFLEQQYTHLAFCSSDVVIRPENIDGLVKTLEQNDYPVLTGVMNIALEAPNVYNITHNTIPVNVNGGFEWYTEKELDGKTKQVGFSGFPLMVLRRDIVKRFEFEGIRTHLHKNYPDIDSSRLLDGALDVVLCWKLSDSAIPIMADTSIRILHLKQLITESEPVLTGKKPSQTLFWSKDRSEPVDIRYR